MKSKVAKQKQTPKIKIEPMEVDKNTKKSPKKRSKAVSKIEKPGNPKTAKPVTKAVVKTENVLASPNTEPKPSVKKSKLKTSSTNDASKPVTKPSLPSKTVEHRNERTIFVGNLPNNVTQKQLKTLFKKFGPVDKVWIRGVKPGSEKITKKVAYMKKLFHKDQISLIAYIAFANAEDANKALILNGDKYENHVLRVTLSTQKDYDVNKGVFVGNLPFSITDEELRSAFNDCGEIVGIRIIRSATGIGKGFGYVNFQSADSVELAMKLDETEVKNRPIRVQRLLSEGKKKKFMKKKAIKETAKVKTGKKLKPDKKNATKKPTNRSGAKSSLAKPTRSAVTKSSPAKPASNPITKSSSAKPKKKKVSILEKKKKVLAEKLQAKPKKK